MNRNFVIQKDVDNSMRLRQFSWQPENDAVTLSWEWPIDRSIRMALVFQCEEEDPDVESLINAAHHHEVIMRDLASHFTTAIPEGRCKLFICPAYFDNDKNIAVCASSFTTDWLYRRTEVSVKVLYSPIHFSQYQKATIIITPCTVEPEAITYAIREHGRNVAVYPLDSAIMASGGHFYIKKTQSVEFILHPNYAHLIDMKA